MPTAGAISVFLLEVDPYDPVTAATIAVRGTTASKWNTDSTDTPASTQYWPGLRLEAYGSSILGGDGTPGGIVDSKSGQIVLTNAHANWDQLLRATWQGRTATVYRVAPGAAHSARTVEIKGYVTAVTIGQTELRLSLQSFNATLNTKDVQAAKFRGRPRQLTFPASSADDVLVGTNAALNFTGSFTIEVLYRMTASSATTRYLAIRTNVGVQYYLRLDTSNKPVFSPNGSTSVTCDTALTVGAWKMISAVYDTTGNTKAIYLDGVLDKSSAETTDPTTQATYNFRWGGDNSSGSCYGEIAEIRVWNTARTQSEILRTLYGGIDRSATGLVYWWQGTYNSSAATTAYDDSMTKQNGTIDAGASWGSSWEGEASLGGTYKPWALGKCYYAQPVLIDSQKLIYAVCSRGFDTDRVPLIWDGANSIPLDDPSSSSDLWNYPTGEVPGTVTAGKAIYDPTLGLIRLGSSPSLGLRVTFTAAKYAGTTSTALPTGALKELVITSGGFSAGDVSITDANFTGFYAQPGLVTYVGKVTASKVAGDNTAAVLTIPGTAAVGDLLLIAGATHNTTPYADNDATFNTPTQSGGSGTYTLLQSGLSSSSGAPVHRSALWWKTMTTGEDDATCGITVVEGTSPNRTFTMFVLHGQNTTSAFADSAEYSPDTTGSTADAPDVTTNKSGDLLACIWITNNVASYSQPAGMTIISNVHQTGGGGNACDMKIAYESRDTAGATGVRTVSGLGSVRQACISAAVTIQPAGSPVLAAECGLYVPAGGMKCSEAIAYVLQSYRAWGGFGFDGVFRAKDLTKYTTGSTPAVALNPNMVRGLVVRGILHPVKEIVAGWRPYWPPYAAGEVSGSVSVDTRADAQKQYRERRFPRVLDRYSRSFTNYNEDAVEIGMETMLVDEWAAARSAEAVQDVRDCMVPFWAVEIEEPANFPNVGDTVTLTDPRLGLSTPVKCIVGSTERTAAEGGYRCSVELIDATTIAIVSGGEE